MKQGNRTVIMRDIHCPYCEKDKAILISRETARKWSLGIPAYGLKFMLSVVYLAWIHIFRYGFKMMDLVCKKEELTYCFCPECGNTYVLGPPEEEKKEIPDAKLYRIKEGSVLRGVCKGISTLTGISLLWIRIASALYGFVFACGFESNTLLRLALADFFSYKILESDGLKMILRIIGAVIMVALYFLFSLFLEEKTSDRDIKN